MLTKNIFPPISKSFKQKLATFRVPGRELHSFAGTPPPEVVIGNNSILFSTISSHLAHAKTYGRNIHPQLRFIAPRFWIDAVHADYDDNYWGQTVAEIPQFVREIFKFIYPKQDPNKAITWLQYKELRIFAQNLLEQELGVPIYRGKPTITYTPSNYYRFNITDPLFNGAFDMPQDVFVYDWYRDFATDSKINPDIMQISHTLLYRFPKRDVPRTLIVLGDGESIIWLAAHFPESTIYYLSRSKEKDPLEKHRKPSHQGLVINNAIKLPFHSSDSSHYENLNPENDKPSNFHFATLVCYEDKALNIKITGHYFSAIGMRPQNHTPMIPDKQVLRLIDEVPKYNFASTKNIPAGGLMDSYLRAMNGTKNSVLEPNAVLLGKGGLTSYLQQLLQKYGINEEDYSDLQRLLHNLHDEKSKFSAMVTLYKEKVSSDPKKVAAFAEEIRELYEKSKQELVRN